MKLLDTPLNKNVFATQKLLDNLSSLYSVTLLTGKWFFRSKDDDADEQKFKVVPLQKLITSNPHLLKLPPMDVNNNLVWYENAWCVLDDEDEDDQFEENDDIDFEAPFDASNLHPEVITYINEKIAQGFYNHREIYGFLEDIFIDDEDVDPDGDFDADDYKDYCRYAVVQKMKTQKQWQTPTTWDKLAQVFDNLCQNKIIALHNAGNTISEGEQEVYEMFCRINEECDKEYKIEPIGYCFYHWQDVDRVFTDNDLTIAFGNIEVTNMQELEYNFKNNKEASISIGQIIVAELEKFGFQVEWEGIIEKRICIINLKWEKKIREAEGLSDRTYKYFTKSQPSQNSIEEIDDESAVWIMLPKTLLPDWSGIYSIHSVETGNAQEAEDFMDEEEAHYGLACDKTDDYVNKINIYNFDGLVFGELLHHISKIPNKEGILLAQVEYTDDEDVCDELLLKLNPNNLQWNIKETFNAIADNYIIFNAVELGQYVLDCESDQEEFPQIEFTLESKKYEVLYTIYEESESQSQVHLCWLK